MKRTSIKLFSRFALFVIPVSLALLFGLSFLSEEPGFDPSVQCLITPQEGYCNLSCDIFVNASESQPVLVRLIAYGIGWNGVYDKTFLSSTNELDILDFSVARGNVYYTIVVHAWNNDSFGSSGWNTRAAC